MATVEGGPGGRDSVTHKKQRSGQRGAERVSPAGEARGVAGRVGEWALKVLALFVILEPIWMLLPFAGFLYGSVFHLQTLARNPSTAWLTHFVFPVLTLGWLGPALVVAGFVLFLVGAGQIYWAKIRKSGLVTNGLYRFVRHPQYISLTLFGIGIFLSWGRAITFIAFFVMMFLYYYLAKSEERTCIRLFGEEYERYREGTSFVIPGDRVLRPLGARVAKLNWPAPVRVAGSFVVAMAVCFGLMWLVKAVKAAARDVPYMTRAVPLGPWHDAPAGPAITAGEVGGVPFAEAGRLAVVRGPHRNATAPGFAERVLERLRASQALKGFLAFLDEPGGDVAICFCAPFVRPERPGTPGMHAGSGGPERRGPPPDPSGADRTRLIILRCTLAPEATVGDAFADRSKRSIRSVCIAPVDLGRPKGEDIVEGDVFTPGPGFPGEKRWDFFLGQLTQRRDSAPGTGLIRERGPGAGRAAAASATLVLVQAPILRTRLDPAFAREILDRLAGSRAFRDQLRKAGAGGEIIPVAFPKPGPNWYREHHGKPQVSVFVILARLSSGVAAAGGDPEALFRPEGRELLGAFTAALDFKIDGPEDSVGAISTIGPRRDLEERWRFFLSGIGGSSGHHHH